MQTTGCWLEAVHQLLWCALRWKDCDTASFQLSLLREGPGDWTTDAPIALSEALYIALTEERPFPEAPIQAAASVKREYRFWKLAFEGGIERNMSYQGKKNIPKITVSSTVIFCSIGCGNFDACCCKSPVSCVAVSHRRGDQEHLRPIISFRCQTWLQGAAGKNTHHEIAWPAAIVTVRQEDEAFS